MNLRQHHSVSREGTRPEADSPAGLGKLAAPRTIVIFESQLHWTPELQRQFAGEDVHIRTSTHVRDISLDKTAEEQPVVVMDLDMETSDCLQLLSRRIALSPFIPVICVCSKRLADLEWTVRELGAVSFFAGPVSGETVANLCRRQWKFGSKI